MHDFQEKKLSLSTSCLMAKTFSLLIFVIHYRYESLKTKSE
ncbi:hypothetical protein HMPREF0454_01811 [Hafnia alvei ATCC 51873]|uniref:Uncharacterized protein n=1 Tax=Hafnia alvei ATCC 51873 TaxID=1002364 RepID=G9Y5K2_HAFAL|nr:hypothetical protein HMPREF0454_01811 [Hafnia alvei ATCC 51873]